MKGFRDTTKTVAGHHNVAGSQFSTFGRQRFATGGTVNRFAHGGAIPHHPDPVHGLHEKGNVRDMHPYGEDHAAVLRNVPATALEEEHGGKGPVAPGYSKGGKATHFHVHKHYHMGGKTKSEHKAYGGKLRKMEMQAEEEAHTGVSPGHTGSTRDHLKGGGPFGHIKKGALHKDMGIPKGQKIPRGKIRSKLAHDKKEHNVKGIRRDTFALNMGKAKGGQVGKQAGEGHVICDTSPKSPDYKTGGTVNKLGAGGALYKRGGRSC